jgi:hypothetical protein
LEKIFILCPPPRHTGSNDTGLMSVWCPGAESIKGHTDRIMILLYRLDSEPVQ